MKVVSNLQWTNTARVVSQIFLNKHRVDMYHRIGIFYTNVADILGSLKACVVLLLNAFVVKTFLNSNKPIVGKHGGWRMHRFFTCLPQKINSFSISGLQGYFFPSLKLDS